MKNDLAARLRDLMARELAALRTSDFRTLEKLTEEKSDLVAAIESGTAALRDTDLAELKMRAAGNARLIEAAREGIKAAAERVRAMRQAQGSLETYARDGRRQSLPTALPRHQHRA